MLPKVTVIIPYKEDRGWLQLAIDSVVTQTYKGEIELILSQSDNRVGYNINRGIEKATGEYIKYLCDDDWLTPNSIEDSVNAIQGYDFIHGNAFNVFGGAKQIQKPRRPHPTFNEMIINNVIHGGTLMYRKDVFDRIGLFNEDLDCAEEYEFNLRCFKNKMRLGYCQKTVYNYRRHEKQKSLGKEADQEVRRKKIHAIKMMYA
jgi:glycosyltransferase involved in cell wall biosynthesis